MESNKHWDNIHSKYLSEEIRYDEWLKDYNDILITCNSSVLDLGCGLGNNTLYLKERGLDVISLDFSQVALDKIKDEIPGAKTVLADISKPLPFDDFEFEIIIADLSLHYFDKETTIKIMQEIKRILRPGGHLIARVNSTKDVNYGAGSGEEIEENYFKIDGSYKRFFSLIDVIKFFSYIGDVKVYPSIITRYSLPKEVYEVVVEKEDPIIM